ncbi:hypothetical protein ACTFRD_17030 [Bacillus cereus group sp. MYBK249-1]|uniref:hypothetical protein n=1 Tax=Bacillus cereus group TaxID=86661 RepID=UPI0011A61960|nr:hypothetical protein [Bacillus cereus]QWS00193.1 hypothetical protein IMY50_11780 [Bacillus cereus]
MNWEDYLKMLATVAPAIATFFIGRWTIKKNHLFDMENKRLYSAYLPLFRIIEPHLYKKLEQEQYLDLINKMMKITDEHYELINPYIIYQIRELKKHLLLDGIIHESFEELCIEIDNEFESIRKSLKLPTRSLIFKLQWRQVRTSTRQTFKEILKPIGQGFYLILVGLGAYAIKEFFLYLIELFH